MSEKTTTRPDIADELMATQAALRASKDEYTGSLNTNQKLIEKIAARDRTIKAYEGIVEQHDKSMHGITLELARLEGWRDRVLQSEAPPERRDGSPDRRSRY